MFVVLEIQEAKDGSVAFVPPVAKETREEAERAFYLVCAAAAVSGLPTHTAMLFTHEGVLIDRKSWHHEQEDSTE